MLEIIKRFTSDLDSALALLASVTSANLAKEVGPFLALLIAVTFSFYILKMATTRVFDTIGFVYFVVRSAMIYSLATAGLLWTSYAYPFISGFGESIGGVIVKRFGGNAAYNETDGFSNVLSDYFTSVVSVTTEVKSYVINGLALSGPELEAIILSFLVIGIAILVVGIAFAILTTAKMFLMLFLGIAPLFLVWSFLGATKSLTNGYIQGLARLIIIQILVFATLGLFVSTSNDIMVQAKLSADASGHSKPDEAFLLTQMWQMLFISAIGAFMLLAVPTMATGLAGGAISVGQTTVAFTTGTLMNAATRAPSAIGGAVQTTRLGINRARQKDVTSVISAADRARKIVSRLK